MSGLENLYREVILDHARARHGFGLHDGAAADSHQVNPTCGDEVTVQLHVGENGEIGEITWEGQGCAISQASTSILASLVHGDDPELLRHRIDAFRELMQSRGEVEGDEELLGDAVVFQGASRYVARVKCAMLGWVAAEDALATIAR
jgi:nitrogen fixation NifU-like protein